MYTWRLLRGYAPVKEAILDDDAEESALKATPLSGIESLSEPIREKIIQKRTALCCGLIVLVIITIVTAVIATHPRNRPISRYSSKGHHIKTHVSSPSKTNNKPHPCGNSSAEARELGCTFHQLTWSWLPPNCPTYANGKFMEAAERPWVFYEDIEATKIAEGTVWEQVLNGELKVFGERREHVTHCIFMFLSLAEIIRDGTPYHERLASYEHIEHCAYLVLGIVKISEGWGDLDTFAGTVSFDQYCT